MARPLSFPRPSSRVLIFLLAASAPGRQMTASASLAAFTPGPSPRGLIRPRPVSLHSRGPPQATSVLDLRASMKDYRKSLVQDKVDRLERMTRSVFQLQDALLQLSTFEKRGGPEEVAQKQIEQPQPKPSSCAVVGTGPAGLATAIMLARRGWDNIVLYDRLPAPPSSDSAEWGDPERSYNIGMDAKGQGCLKSIDVWDRVSSHCAEVRGRVDWMPGSDTPQTVDFIEKFGSPIQVIQRDCLTALLREEIDAKYSTKIRMEFNTECQSIDWGEDPVDPVKLRFQRTHRTFPRGEVRGSRPTVVPVGEPWVVEADFVVGADGAASRVRQAMEADPSKESGFDVVRFADNNMRVFKTISLKVPDGYQHDVDYSAVSLEDIIIDALPLKDGKMIGVVLFRPEDSRVTEAKTGAQARELFEKYLPQFVPFINDEGFAAFAAKREQRLPSFQYCGPVVHRRANTVLLGDAIHTVKPFFGFGINTALDDIRWLDHCLSCHPTSRAEALATFSSMRGTEAVSIVEISQQMDQPGIKGLLAFLGPLVLDSLFEKLMPGVFHPNLLIYCREEGMTFTEARRRKKRDLQIQLSFLSAQVCWGGMAAKMYTSERLAAPLLLASQKISAASLVAALATMFQMPLVHLVAGTVSSMITFAAETTIG